MQDLAYYTMGMFGVLTVEGSNIVEDREGPFWTRVGQIAAISTGFVSAYLTGTKALMTAIDTIGADPYGFGRYGGNSFLGDFTGAFECIFSLFFLFISIEMAVAPLFLSYRMNRQLDVNVSIEQDMNNMWIMATVVLGAFFGYFAVDEGVEHSIDFFNNFDTDPSIGEYHDLEWNNDNEYQDVKARYNNVVFMYDVGNHTIITSVYLVMSFVASNGFFDLAWTMIEGDISPLN